MPDLLAGEVILAQDTPPAVSDREDALISGFSSTSYQTGATVCGTTFTAPTSGRVLVSINAYLDNSDAAGQAFASYIIREGSSIGSGTTVVGAADEQSALQTGQAQARKGVSELVSGLTAGDAYNVVMVHKHAGTGTSDIAWRTVSVIPTP